MKTSSIVGYFGSYQAAYNRVGKRFKESGKFSIELDCSRRRDHPYTLIYYGNFV